MEITKEDIQGLVKTLELNISTLRNKNIEERHKITIVTLSLESLKHNIQNNMHRLTIQKMKGEE